MIHLIFLTLALAVPPDAATLVQSVIALEKAEWPKRQKYTWREEVIRRHFDKTGKEEPATTETFDVLFVEGATYRKLILENGKPLPPRNRREWRPN